MIRWLGAADLAGWREIRSEALRDCPQAFLTSLADFQARPDAVVAEQLAQGRVLAVFEGDKIIATAAYTRLGLAQIRHRAKIEAVFTHKNARRRGVARALFEALAEHARAQGVSQLELYVEASNAGAKGFYESVGFKQFGTLPGAVKTVRGLADDDFYVWHLGAAA